MPISGSRFVVMSKGPRATSRGPAAAVLGIVLGSRITRKPPDATERRRLNERNSTRIQRCFSNIGGRGRTHKL